MSRVVAAFIVCLAAELGGCSGSDDPAGRGAAGSRSDDGGAGSSGGGAAGAAGTAGRAGAAGDGGSTTAWEDALVQTGRYHYESGGEGPSFVEILDVVATDDRVFLCTATQGLLVVNRNADTLPIIAQITATGAGARCQHLAVDGSRLVFTNRGDELSPVPQVTVFDLGGQFGEVALVQSSAVSYEGIAVLEPGLYAVAVHGDGVAVLRDDGAGALAEVARLPGFENAWDVVKVGDRLYVADDGYGLRVVDVSTPAAPTLVGSVPLAGSIKHVSHGDGRLFVSAGARGVHVLTAGDAPTVVGTIETPGSALQTAHDAGHLFVADWNDVRAFDVTEPDAAVLVATENISVGTFSRVLALDADAGQVFLGEWTGLYGYDFFPGRVAPDIRVSASHVQFPETAPGSESAFSLIVHNDGRVPLTVGSIEGTAELQPLAGSLTVAPGGNDFVEVRFRPTDAQPVEGSLVLRSDDPDQPQLTVRMRGNSPGVGVGDPVPAMDWIDLQSGQPLSTATELGNVLLLTYFATF